MGQEIARTDEIQTHDDDYGDYDDDDDEEYAATHATERDEIDSNRFLASVVHERARQRGSRIRAATDRIRNFRPTKSRLSICTYGYVNPA